MDLAQHGKLLLMVGRKTISLSPHSQRHHECVTRTHCTTRGLMMSWPHQLNHYKYGTLSRLLLEDWRRLLGKKILRPELHLKHVHRMFHHLVC